MALIWILLKKASPLYSSKPEKSPRERREKQRLRTGQNSDSGDSATLAYEGQSPWPGHSEQVGRGIRENSATAGGSVWKLGGWE